MPLDRMQQQARASAYRWPQSHRDPYHCEWGAVVGDRVRRLRRDRDLTLLQLAPLVRRPCEPAPFSVGYFSRLERGSAKAKLFTYLAIADALDIDPGRLLGPDAASLEVTDAEMVLLRFLRDLQVSPHEALTVYARATPMCSSSPSIRAGSAPSDPAPSYETATASVSPET